MFPAVTSFIKNTRGIQSDAQLVSSVHMFGKYSGLVTGQMGKVGNKLAGIKRIGVQPTAVARRKRMAVGGRKSDQRGRPPKCKYTPEHGYSKPSQKNKSPLLPAVLPPKKQCAPHNLSECVTRKESLGKNSFQKVI